MASAKRRRKTPGPQAGRPYMPGYGVPKDQKGLLPWSWAERRLKQSHNYWVSTTWPDGRPHVMVVWGLWLDGALYFSSGRQSRKAKNLAKNPNCVICTEHAQEAVILQGVAQEVRERTRIAEFIGKYERKYSFDMSAFKEPLYQHKDPLYAVHPRVVFALPEKGFPGKVTRWRFS